MSTGLLPLINITDTLWHGSKLCFPAEDTASVDVNNLQRELNALAHFLRWKGVSQLRL